MVIHSYGFAPKSSSDLKEGLDLFTDNLPLLLEFTQSIRKNSTWKSIELPFAWCSWPYISGDGPLALGMLLEGYLNGLLKEPCPDCSDECFVTVFSGSPLSGSNSWSGFCLTCNEAKKARDSIHKPFTKRIFFVVESRKLLGKTTLTLYDLLRILKSER
jgi:hypothetical protein